MAFTLAQAKTLCNASELKLVSASTRNEIGKLSAARLRQKIALARKQRDKWRDQAKSQRRATQEKQRGRQTSDNARSAKKAELFADVLQRFETQLAKVDGQGNRGVAAKKSTPRKVRAVQHRSKRAAARDALEKTREELEVEKKVARQKVAKKKHAAKAALADKPTDEPAEPAAKPSKRTKPTAKTSTEAALSPLEAARTVQGLGITSTQQRRARTVAKQNRYKASGSIRTQKHVSGRNKRHQARRDSR